VGRAFRSTLPNPPDDFLGLVIGPVGSGKTYLMKKVAALYDCLILDLIGEWEGFGANVYDPSVLPSVVKRGGSVVFHPPNLDPIWFPWALQVAAARRKEVGPTVFVCDEIARFAETFGPTDYVAEILARRRHYRLGLLLGTQRPAFLPSLLPGQWSHLVTFRFMDPRDRDWMKRMNYRTWEAAETLGKHEYVLTVPTGEISKGKDF